MLVTHRTSQSGYWYLYIIRMRLSIIITTIIFFLKLHSQTSQPLRDPQQLWKRAASICNVGLFLVTSVLRAIVLLYNSQLNIFSLFYDKNVINFRVNICDAVIQRSRPLPVQTSAGFISMFRHCGGTKVRVSSNRQVICVSVIT